MFSSTYIEETDKQQAMNDLNESLLPSTSDNLDNVQPYPYNHPQYNNNNNNNEQYNNEQEALVDETHNAEMRVTNRPSVVPGERQPARFRDAWAAILFVGQLVTVLYFSFTWGPWHGKAEVDNSGTTQDNDDSTMTIRVGGLLGILAGSTLISGLSSVVALSIMTRFASQLIQVSLWLTVVMDVCLLVFWAWQGYWVGFVATLIMSLVMAHYAYSVMPRVPWAAANVHTAVTAVQSNGGVFMLAYATVLGAMVWMFLWTMAVVGIYSRETTCTVDETDTMNDGNDLSCKTNLPAVVGLALLLSYYWTMQVIEHVLHVTVSGVVGTWWFCPDEACTFCSPALTDSMVRASTSSLGSVAFGSLITAVLQVLYQVLREVRQRHHGRQTALMVCILQFLVQQLERATSYVNKWAYVYVGLYGYDYMTSGHKVMLLFRQRGWTTIVNDNLVYSVLSLVTVVVAIWTGGIGMWMSSYFQPSAMDALGSAAPWVAFGVPALMGYAMSSIVMSVVASAVDTVVVAFAEAPMEFERNHPGLFTAMVAAWRQVYPQECGL
jgi:Plasma-membrane choline transporter